MTDRLEIQKRDHKTTIRVHIDRRTYRSPGTTTGKALYELAHIGERLELFREVEGDEHDELVPREVTVIHLHEDEHFYSRRDQSVTLIVNLDEKAWEKRRISYEEVTLLAFPNPPPGSVITYSVEYSDGPRRNPEGSLTEGRWVKVCDKMVFSLTETARS